MVRLLSWNLGSRYHLNAEAAVDEADEIAWMKKHPHKLLALRTKKEGA
jgi:hypothetical protein